MKTLFALLLCFSSTAFAKDSIKDSTVTGASAKAIMAALAGSGFEIKNLDQEWGKAGILSAQTGPIFCHVSGGAFPDGWLSDARCYRGTEESGEVLVNSMALLTALQAYAPEDDGLSNRWFAVKDVRCSLLYNKRAYRCRVTPGDR